MTIAEVRDAYMALRDRAHAANPTEWIYIALIWAEWDKVLAGFGDDTAAPSYADFLTRTITNPRLHPSDLLEWMDAYPDGVKDRLPGGLFSETLPFVTVHAGSLA